MSDEYFLVRGRLIFEMGFYLSPILHNFHLCGKKTERQTDKQFKLNCYIRKKKKEKNKGKGKRKGKGKSEKGKGREKRKKKQKTENRKNKKEK